MVDVLIAAMVGKQRAVVSGDVLLHPGLLLRRQLLRTWSVKACSYSIASGRSFNRSRNRTCQAAANSWRSRSRSFGPGCTGPTTVAPPCHIPWPPSYSKKGWRGGRGRTESWLGGGGIRGPWRQPVWSVNGRGRPTGKLADGRSSAGRQSEELTNSISSAVNSRLSSLMKSSSTGFTS